MTAPDLIFEGTWHSLWTVQGGPWITGPWKFANREHPGFFHEDGTFIPYHAVIFATRTEPKERVSK